ncbi:serine/threonine dehydratase [Azorhizobium oxalatiphilum]|uniref:Serine/threonine dehydratase n=1 Tax=Azorhizobium oxalatiphilum TaxID=980631 RepID=A0A917F8C7_9HYPH|nr:serine/threonine dehydratase [Azorhizobium oxalatiphilum]
MSQAASALASAAVPTVTIADVEAANARIDGQIVRTPLLESAVVNEACGARILIKPEMLQHTGSFKYRGACHRVSQMTDAERRGGIVAWSSGNHALAISAVAARNGIKATILMPSDAPRTKVEGARRLGGTVRLYDRATEVREEIGAEIARETGAIIVPPYDDPYVIAGQGTVGLELAEGAKALGVTLDAALLACSGGGLVSGAAIALSSRSPATKVYAVEPAGFDDLARSLASGKPERNAAGAKSLCDALQVPTPGEITFPLCQALLAGSLVVSDDEVKRAMRLVYDALKLVVEPGGVVTLAAVLAGKLDVAGKTIGVVLSGGNVDADKFATIIAA